MTGIRFRHAAFLLGVAAVLLPRPWTTAGPADKAPAEADGKAFDYRQIQSPPLPAPEGLTFIDQGARDPRLKGYLTPAGFKLEIVAEDPVVVNPVGMTFADDGTPFVIEWHGAPGENGKEAPETFRYKDGTTRTVATIKKHVKDPVKTLTDTAGTGTYDKATVVLEDELPSSILVHDGWVYLSGRGTVRRFRRSKENGPYDVKEVVAQGFCAFSHHQVSGLTLGHDGWLYVTSGDCDNVVEGSDGSRATVLRTGGVFRCRPDGSRMHAFAIGFRNPYRDVSFDAAGNLFHADNDNEDGTKFMGCRLMHVAEGNDFGWRLFTGALCCRPDPVRGAAFGELPGKVAPLLKTGRGAPAGLLVYNDARLPEAYRGLLFYPDVYRQLVRAYRVVPDGATFKAVEEFELLRAPGDKLFRPCQMLTGPDGAVYVVDWRVDSGGAGRHAGDGRRGRIYRLSWSGTKDEPALPLRKTDSWAGFAKMSDKELLETLESDEESLRGHARAELARRGAKNRAALLEIPGNDKRPLRARLAALGALQGMWDASVEKAFLALLVGGDADLRRLAADGLALNAARGDERVHAELLKALTTDEPAVKRAVVLAMSHVAGAGSADALASTLAFDDGRDAYLRDGILRGIENLGAPGIKAVLSLAESGVRKDTDKVVEAFRAFRTRAAYDALPALLKNPHLSPAQQADLVRSATNYLLDPPVSLDPVLTWVLSREKPPAAVTLAGLEVLSTPGTVRGPAADNWLVGLLDDPAADTRLAAVRAVQQGRVGKGADALVRLLARRDRGAGERKAAAGALRALHADKVVEKLRPLVADDKDDGSVRREAFLTLAELDPAGITPVARALLASADPALQSSATSVLGTTAAGACEAGKLFVEKKLPRRLLPEVSEGLRKHAGKDPAAARLLGEVMKSGLSVALTPEEVARVEALVKTRGNPRRGKALFLNAAAVGCVNCHKLEGVGGNVGPDLTRVWDTHPVGKILESIVEPSKEIKEGYQTFRATTRKGQVYQGLRVSQTPAAVVIREATGKDVRVAAADLEELTPLKTSLMPDNSVAGLSYDQFIDLIAFLRNRAEQESLRK